MSARLNRRELLLLSAAGLAANLSGARAAGETKAQKPNILFILADDMGYADLSVYGRKDYRTPILDRLAKQGLLMTSGYSNSAVCSATRTALITGRYQYRLHVGLFEPGGMGDPDYGLPEGHPTLPSLLRELGYRTSLFGKWHLGNPPKYSPIHTGYDYFFGFLGGATDYFRVAKGQTIFGPGMETPGAGGGAPPVAAATADELAIGMRLYENDQPVEVPGYLTDLLADRAAKEIASCAATHQPFFLSLHFNAPHWPWEGPKDEEASKSVKSLGHNDGGSIRKYGEMVVALDSAIGRVLEQLKRSGIERDTLVVFTSDNGGERFSDVWPFVGAKGELLEGGLRVPLIVRWPGRIMAGSKSDQPMITMDFLPTLLAAAGGKPDPAYPSDGINLLPVLTGEQRPFARKLFWRYKASDQAAVRDGDWKYLKIADHEYLFNVAEDQRERANLRASNKELFQRLKSDYETWNAGMLPYPATSYSDNMKGKWADRY